MKKLAIMLIKIYQKTISRYLIPYRSCRFYPTCSDYTIEAIEKYGFFKGGFMGFKRILRCNPFNPGGYDPVK
nr:membrane protein insertion efficiency factor YidD [Sporanaerobacter acetigenes]